MSSYCILFPGQGSQAVGMGQFLYQEFQVAKNIYDEASEAIQVDLKKLCFEGPESELNLTENTQPALLTTSVATAEVLRKIFNVQPVATAGHSIGEYSSLVLADVIPFATAVKAVKLRGKEMQKAVPVGEGGMFATLGLTTEQAQFLCRWTEEKSGFKPLSPANFNCEGQIVISGSAKALNWLKENFKPEIFTENGLPEARRAKLIPLTVSAPFHCAMMLPAENAMREFLTTVEFKNASLPVYQNFTAQKMTEGSKIKENLIRQVSGSVLWTQTLLQMHSEGHRQFIECGHGTVLKGLLKKISADFEVLTTQNHEELKIIKA